MKALDWADMSGNSVTFDIHPQFLASEVVNFESELTVVNHLIHPYMLHWSTKWGRSGFYV